MRVGVISFPGSNGDHDALSAVELGLGQTAEAVYYRDTDLSRFDALLIPGGFSYGDYLRAGAIARFAPVMASVARFAAQGGPILGICNGFQILTEAGLLPGALLGNASLSFRCDWQEIEVVNGDTAWTDGLQGQALKLPIAHGQGRYFADRETLARIEARGQVVFRYVGSNPNGSVNAIAGVANEAGNVVGLMPHPERAYDPLIGGADGLRLLSRVVHGDALEPATPSSAGRG